VYCVPLKTVPIVASSGNTTEVVSLLLEMAGEVNTFRRIGHFVMGEEDMQEYVDLQVGGLETGPVDSRELSTMIVL
jgi:hypothetical protein